MTIFASSGALVRVANQALRVNFHWNTFLRVKKKIFHSLKGLSVIYSLRTFLYKFSIKRVRKSRNSTGDNMQPARSCIYSECDAVHFKETIVKMQVYSA